MNKIVLVLISLMLIFTGCSKSQDKELEAKISDLEQQVAELSEENIDHVDDSDDDSGIEGYFKESHYYNDLLGFSFKFPKEWEIQGKEQLEHITNVGAELIAGDDESLKGSLEVTNDTMIKFNLIAYKYPLGTPGKLNPNIMVIGEDISIYTGVNDEEDYIASLKELYANAQVEIKVIEEGSVSIDGHDFNIIHTSLMTSGIEVNQVMHVRIVDGVAVGIIVTYFDEETKNEVFNVLYDSYNSIN